MSTKSKSASTPSCHCRPWLKWARVCTMNKFIMRRKRNGDSSQPCFTPMSTQKNSERSWLCGAAAGLMINVNETNRVSYDQTFFQSLPRCTLFNAFVKSMKLTNSLCCSSMLCLLIVLKMKICSEQHQQCNNTSFQYLIL